MTFDEWLDSTYPYAERPDESHWAMRLIKEAWNAGYAEGFLAGSQGED